MGGLTGSPQHFKGLPKKERAKCEELSNDNFMFQLDYLCYE